MRKANGQLLVEAAIILPLLLGLVFCIVDFSRAIYTKNTLNQAARSGARTAAVTSPLSPTAPAPLSLAAGEPAETMKRNLASGIPADETVLYEIKILDASGAPITGTVSSGNEVIVTLTYSNFPMITPAYKLLALMSGTSYRPSSATIDISGEATMRYE